MGMTITVEIIDPRAAQSDLDDIFGYFIHVDQKFSVFKETSEISLINSGKIKKGDYSEEMEDVLYLSEETRKETNGYFDIRSKNGGLDPSGLVKGWAISQAAGLIRKKGFEDFYVDAGGDIEVSGRNQDGALWRVGIRNPFNVEENAKVLALSNRGIATSGIYLRGQHIYDPHQRGKGIEGVASLTVIGPDAYEADRFATAAFAMGEKGIGFIEARDGLEGYLIKLDGKAVLTSGFEQYAAKL